MHAVSIGKRDGSHVFLANAPRDGAGARGEWPVSLRYETSLMTLRREIQDHLRFYKVSCDFLWNFRN